MRLVLLAFALLWSSFAWAGVNVNTATAAELDTLPGIGPSKAEAIVAYRTENGPFASVDQLDDVPGIGPATLASLRDLVEIGGDAMPAAAPVPAASPPETPAAPAATSPLPSSTGAIDVNTASADALTALPGIGPTKAEAIVVDREKNGPYSSCQDLTRVTGIGSATVTAIADRCAASAP